MFKSKTVFILGAGASIPYGFPSGYKLVTDIKNNLELSTNITMLSKVAEKLIGTVHWFDPKQIKYLLESLSNTVVNSIDDFLEKRKVFLILGKAAIAQALIPYENQSLFSREEDKNWYSLIWYAICKDVDKLEDKQISFVTFNYDRSLEHYLYSHLKNHLNLSDSECKAVMNKIPIIHVYGHMDILNGKMKKTFVSMNLHAMKCKY
jgi:hypothetical protein